MFSSIERRSITDALVKVRIVANEGHRHALRRLDLLVFLLVR